MDLKTETAEQAILRVLAESGNLEPVTLHRIVSSNAQTHSARQISTALLNLRRSGMIDQTYGGRGMYRLTDAGVAIIADQREPHSLSAVIPHPGPEALDLTTGHLTIGLDAKGEAVKVPLWDSIGTRAFVASGVTGAGTTNVLAGIIEAASPHAPHVRTWVVDTSVQLAEYRGRVDRSTTDQISSVKLLDDVLRVQDARNEMLARTGKKAWNTPFDQLRLPLGLLVISALYGYETPEFYEKLGHVLRMARKTGIAVVTDVPSLTLECFGDYLTRETFLAGTVLRMRSVGPIDRQIGNQAQVKCPQIDSTFEDGSTTAGLAYLPNGHLLRAFWASGL